MALGVLVLSILSVLGFGYMSAAMFMLANAKGGNEPINWFISTLQGLVSGVYFPISVMPNWLQWISLCLPQTYGIDAARRLLLVGKSGDVTIPTQALLPFSPLVTDIMMLILFIVILLPLGLWVFKLGLNKAKVDGGLSRWS
jgi:ABC-2 type transport system permease protein